DQSEAMAMSDRVILMNDGVIEQVGPPRELYGRPRTRFAAEFIGTTNVFTGDAVTTGGRTTLPAEGLPGPLTLAAPVPGDGPQDFVCRPESLVVHEGTGGGDNVFEGLVTSAAYLGASCDLVVSVGGLELRVSTPGSLEFTVGST